MHSAKPGNLSIILFAIASLLIGGVPIARSNVIDFDTGLNSLWTITAGGAVNATPYYFALPLLSVTSNESESGTFLPGGTLSQFNGIWYADFSFNLPQGAAGVSLSFSNLTADDRVVLMLNATAIGDYFLNGGNLNPPLTGTGVFDLFSGPESYTYTATTSGTITTGFLTGANDLRLYVNNTGTQNLTAAAQTFTSSGDGTSVGVLGNITYSMTTVPEPESLALLASL